MYPNAETTCHIRLKFFLWTWLLKNLLLAKYFISAAAPLSNISDQAIEGKMMTEAKKQAYNICKFVHGIYINPLQISTIIWKWGWKKAFATNFLFLLIHPNPPPLSSQNLQSETKNFCWYSLISNLNAELYGVYVLNSQVHD